MNTSLYVVCHNDNQGTVKVDNQGCKLVHVKTYKIEDYMRNIYNFPSFSGVQSLRADDGMYLADSVVMEYKCYLPPFIPSVRVQKVPILAYVINNKGEAMYISETDDYAKFETHATVNINCIFVRVPKGRSPYKPDTVLVEGSWDMVRFLDTTQTRKLVAKHVAGITRLPSDTFQSVTKLTVENPTDINYLHRNNVSMPLLEIVTLTKRGTLSCLNVRSKLPSVAMVKNRRTRTNSLCDINVETILVYGRPEAVWKATHCEKVVNVMETTPNRFLVDIREIGRTKLEEVCTYFKDLSHGITVSLNDKDASTINTTAVDPRMLDWINSDFSDGVYK